MAKTNDFQSCQLYVQNYMDYLKKQLNECQLELLKQSECYSIKELSLDHLDQCLKEFVDSQRNYLFKRNNEKLNKFKDSIYLKKLFETLSNYNLHQQQVCLFFVAFILKLSIYFIKRWILFIN